MRNTIYKYIIPLLAGCFLLVQNSAAQNADINFVRAVNPQGEKSFLFRGLSSSVYSVSLAIPAGNFVYGVIKKDKCVKVRSYEELGSVIITGIITAGVKTTVDRARPYEKYSGVYPEEYENGKSFPSAHSAIAFATATTLSLQCKKWYVVVPAYVWAAGCGFSRIYLGEHYPSDVLAGAAIGVGSAFVSRWITKKIFKPCSVLKEPM